MGRFRVARLPAARTLFQRFLGLDRRRRSSVFWATGALLLVRLALLLLPFRKILRWADTVKPRTVPPGDEEVEAKVWATTVVGNRLFPTTPCLTQATVVHRLLRRAGRPSELRIGVGKDQQGTFGAHAWVESNGEVIVGGEALSQTDLIPLPPFGGSSSAESG